MLRGMRRSAAVAVIALSALMGLAACSNSTKPLKTTSSSSLPEGSYQSRGAALIRLKAFYAEYIDKSAEIAAAGGQNSTALRPYVTDAQYEDEVASLRRYSDIGAHLKGHQKVKAFALQRVELDSGKASAYVCLNVQDARIVNKAGDDITPASRAPEVTLLVRFVTGPRIESSEVWPGQSIC